MIQSEFTLKYKPEDLKLFKNLILLYVFSDIILIIENSNIAIGSFQFGGRQPGFFSFIIDTITFILSNSLLYVLYTLYRKYPNSFSSKKIFYFYILADLINILLIILSDTNFLPPNYVITSIPSSSDSLNSFFGVLLTIDIIFLIGSIFWVIFANYFTLWFNNSFSIKTDRIKAFFIASLFNLVSILLQILSLIFYSVDLSYGEFLLIEAISVMIYFSAIIIEVFACIEMYRRLQEILLGRYNPIRQPFYYPSVQPTNLPSYSQFGNKTPVYQDFIYCTNCGAKIPAVSQFCLTCGTKVRK